MLLVLAASLAIAGKTTPDFPIRVLRCPGVEKMPVFKGYQTAPMPVVRSAAGGVAQVDGKNFIGLRTRPVMGPPK